MIASEGSKAFDDPGVFVPIPLVNQIRPRVKAWREAGYPGVTGITKRLLEHWTNPEDFETRRFFFCQLEAIETLIWLTEAPAADKVGIDVPSDGGDFRRLCAKMATGSGKTIVMAMAIAWHILNKVTYPQDARFFEKRIRDRAGPDRPEPPCRPRTLTPGQLLRGLPHRPRRAYGNAPAGQGDRSQLACAQLGDRGKDPEEAQRR